MLDGEVKMLIFVHTNDSCEHISALGGVRRVFRLNHEACEHNIT